MRQVAGLAVWVAALVVLATASPVSADSMDTGQAFTKLTRGAANTLTGWVEIPKRIHETSQLSGSASGFTWGLLRGFGYGYIRTVSGLYEVFTFPYPAPSGYETVLEPEYVFTTAQEDVNY